MPQASDELRARWNGPDDSTAIEFLHSAGFTHKSTGKWAWWWVVPDGHHITEAQESAVQFLVEEWDWGGMIRESDLADPPPEE